MGMEWYWWLLELSANLVEAIMLVVFIQQFSQRRYKSIFVLIFAVILVFCLNTFISVVYNLIFVFKLLFLICAGIMVGFFVFKGNTISRLLLSLVMTALLIVADLLPAGILQIALRINFASFLDMTAYRLLGTIISKVFLIILVFLIGRIANRDNYRIPFRYSMCIVIIPVVSIVCMIAIGQNAIYDVNNVLNSIWFALSAVGLLFVNLLIIYLFQAFMRFSQNQSRLQLMVQQTDMLNNHLRETNALQEETQRIWHDMKNHFNVIQWMVKSKNYDKLDQYMITLNDAVAASMPKFQTGNTIIDALLNTKAIEAKKCGIELDANAVIPAKVSIEDIDLNILLSNALDNAIEACRKIPEGQDRTVSVDAHIKNDHFVLVIKNPYTGEIKTSGDTLQTTKKDSGRHGIGIGNMKRTVEKYDGHIMSNYENNLFILTAIMHC
jgi:two-component system, LytTR family, sensor histidine kinase AgrC